MARPRDGALQRPLTRVAKLSYEREGVTGGFHERQQFPRAQGDESDGERCELKLKRPGSGGRCSNPLTRTCQWFALYPPRVADQLRF